MHTREYKKETPSQTSYLLSGIIKSSKYFVQDFDYPKSSYELKLCYLKSDYLKTIVQDILSQAPNTVRDLTSKITNVIKHNLQVTVLCGTGYEQTSSKFVSRVNDITGQYKIYIELVKTNYLSIVRLVFNNCDQNSFGRM